MLRPTSLLPFTPILSAFSQSTPGFLVNHRWALLTSALFLVVGLVVFDDYGFTWDEASQREIGVLTIDYALGRSDELLRDWEKVYGPAVEVPLLLAERALGLTDNRDIYLSRHLLSHLLFIVGGFFGYLLVYRLSGRRWLALFALLFFLLWPRIYAHSYFNTKDVPLAAALLIALYLVHRAFRRDTVAAFLLCGVGVGLLTNVRLMGMMLFPAVVAMRGLDLLFADGPAQRKHIILTGGVFVLAALLTLYATWPWLWADPIGHFREAFTTLSNFANPYFNLFQGELVYTEEIPPRYVPTWIALTYPPAVLLVGLLGLAMVCWQGIVKPGAIFRNTEVRFAFLLLAAFAGPVLAVVALDAHLYSGQRHLFFVYAPFSLLAVLGLYWLGTAFKSRPWRAGMYGLAGLGAALLALQLAQLHPLQNLYFNPLADRKTPDYLRSQYDWDYHFTAYWEGINWLLRAYPDRQLVVDTDQAVIHRFLPPAARARVRLHNAGDADFYITAHRKRALDTGESRRFSTPLYSRQIYNNTILSVVKAADINAVRRAEYQHLVAADPAASSDFDLYLNGNTLTYAQESCTYNPRQWFYLDILPQNPADVPKRTRDRGYASYPVKLFPHLDRFDGKCASAFILPSYPIAAISTGEAQVWQAQIYLDLDKYRAAYDRITAGLPSTSAVFDLYFEDATLSYVKEPCTAADIEQPFFLNIVPQDPNDLPEKRREIGFTDLRFNFPFPHGRLFDGKCLATFPLPDYPIATIHTGQIDPEQNTLWSATIYADLGQYRAAYQSLISSQPTHRTVFNLYHQGRQLSYVKESCTPADAETRFFLHLIPVDGNDLPPERRQYGSDNLDFKFYQHGRRFDDQCLAIVSLPDYPIRAIRTGQLIPDAGNVWETEFLVDRIPEFQEVYQTISSRRPADTAVFDLHLRDNRLIYLKESCTPADTNARFFLHLVPVEVNDLPAERRPWGTHNLDFDFAQYGGHFDGKCLAILILPEYPIKEIRTGQFIIDGDRLWETAFAGSGS